MTFQDNHVIVRRTVIYDVFDVPYTRGTVVGTRRYPGPRGAALNLIDLRCMTADMYRYGQSAFRVE